MKQFQRLLLLIMSIFSFFSCKAQDKKIPASIYEFTVKALDGSDINFADFKGKKILIVNTASKCGFTPQYEDLEKLYQTYKDKLVIVGFPSNNFLFQEPGTNEEIATFCKKNYGVSFPMAEKIAVKGKNMAPIYKWLTNKDYNKLKNSSVSWNFQKYLIDENGNLIEVFSPKTNPQAQEIIDAIEK
jgi:glutathione peroxidase